MTPPPDLSHLTEAQKDALILVLWQQVQELSARVAELEAKLGEPPLCARRERLLSAGF